MIVVTKSILKSVYKKRKPWSHKGDYGHLLVVGGSELYTGAPFLAALAALASGCDLVTVAAPERAANIAAKNINLITYPLSGACISGRHINGILELSEGKDAVLVGNGIGRRKETLGAINKLMEKISVPCVIDADGIHAVSGRNAIKNSFVITPHEAEFYALTGKRVDNNLKSRIEAVKSAASRFNCTILLKGRVAVVSDGKEVAINRTVSEYATKGGIGDVMAGACGSLLAQGTSPFDAACAATYIIGAAAKTAEKGKKQSMLATDVIEKICGVIG